MDNPQPSLHDIHLDIESTLSALWVLIFLLDQYGHRRTDTIDAQGMCQLLELINQRLKTVFKNMSAHTLKEEMVRLHSNQGAPYAA